MKDFPILKRKIKGKPLTYLDSAATSLTPQPVIDAMHSYYHEHNANIHRGIHTMGEEATEHYEKAHEKVAKLINARANEVVFTKSATESLNLLAYNLTKKLGVGDNVVLTEMEHHSNLVPWQQLAKQKGFEVRYIPVKHGMLDLGDAAELIDDTTKVVSVVHVSNFLGTMNQVRELAEISRNARVVVDAAQSVPHMPVDVQKLGADFIAFSGHKMLGPTGVGVMWGRENLLEKMEPFLYGGDMVKEVTFEDTTFNELPWKFEAGTPNISGGIGMGAAADYLMKYGMDKVFSHSRKLARKCVAMLNEMGAEVYGPEERAGIVSFNLPDVHSHDVSSVLDQEGIAIRGGHHCTMPMHQKIGISSSCRASFHIYNNEDNIEKLRQGLLKAKEVLS